jgi:hypothetical protein
MRRKRNTSISIIPFIILSSVPEMTGNKRKSRHGLIPLGMFPGPTNRKQ